MYVCVYVCVYVCMLYVGRYLGIYISISVKPRSSYVLKIYILLYMCYIYILLYVLPLIPNGNLPRLAHSRCRLIVFRCGLLHCMLGSREGEGIYINGILLRKAVLLPWYLNRAILFTDF